jgi:hypothetical protein
MVGSVILIIASIIVLITDSSSTVTTDEKTEYYNLVKPLNSTALSQEDNPYVSAQDYFGTSKEAKFEVAQYFLVEGKPGD